MPEEKMLVTWGEIAAFFKVTKKTAIRWHKDCGMPIVRQPLSDTPMQYPSVLWSWAVAFDEARRKRGL